MYWILFAFIGLVILAIAYYLGSLSGESRAWHDWADTVYETEAVNCELDAQVKELKAANARLVTKGTLDWFALKVSERSREVQRSSIDTLMKKVEEFGSKAETLYQNNVKLAEREVELGKVIEDYRNSLKAVTDEADEAQVEIKALQHQLADARKIADDATVDQEKFKDFKAAVNDWLKGPGSSIARNNLRSHLGDLLS